MSVEGVEVELALQSFPFHLNLSTFEGSFKWGQGHGGQGESLVPPYTRGSVSLSLWGQGKAWSLRVHGSVTLSREVRDKKAQADVKKGWMPRP